MSREQAATHRRPNATHRAQASNGYTESLRRCAAVAREEFVVARATFSAGRARIAELSAKFGRAAGDIQRDGQEFRRSRESLEALRTRLDAEVKGRFENAEHHLGRLQRHLGQFTLALFGRTMAGKSTIREALTRGDGSTIGRGAQNTTRDLHEYDWNHLRILDAPGIASSDERVRPQLDALARTAFEEADLVLFMLSSDGIQELVFEDLRDIRDMAKPIVFLVNYKLDLTKDVLRRRFLREGGLDSPRAKAEVEGHELRLRSFACEHLGMRPAEVNGIGSTGHRRRISLPGPDVYRFFDPEREKDWRENGKHSWSRFPKLGDGVHCERPDRRVRRRRVGCPRTAAGPKNGAARTEVVCHLRGVDELRVLIS